MGGRPVSKQVEHFLNLCTYHSNSNRKSSFHNDASFFYENQQGRFLHSFKDHHKRKKMELHMVKPYVKRVLYSSQRTFWDYLIWICKLVSFQRFDCIFYCFPCDTAFVNLLFECKGIHSKTLFWNSNRPDHVKGICRFLCWTLNFFFRAQGFTVCSLGLIINIFTWDLRTKSMNTT